MSATKIVTATAMHRQLRNGGYGGRSGTHGDAGSYYPGGRGSKADAPALLQPWEGSEAGLLGRRSATAKAQDQTVLAVDQLIRGLNETADTHMYVEPILTRATETGIDIGVATSGIWNGRQLQEQLEAAGFSVSVNQVTQEQQQRSGAKHTGARFHIDFEASGGAKEALRKAQTICDEKPGNAPLARIQETREAARTASNQFFKEIQAYHTDLSEAKRDMSNAVHNGIHHAIRQAVQDAGIPADNLSPSYQRIAFPDNAPDQRRSYEYSPEEQKTERLYNGAIEGAVENILQDSQLFGTSFLSGSLNLQARTDNKHGTPLGTRVERQEKAFNELQKATDALTPLIESGGLKEAIQKQLTEAKQPAPGSSPGNPPSPPSTPAASTAPQRDGGSPGR